MDTTSEKSLLWEISGKGLDSSSYLFGTVHIIEKEHFILTEATQNALTQTRQLALELDLEEVNSFSLVVPLLMRSIMWDGTTLDSLMSEEDYDLLKKEFSGLSIPLQDTPFFNKIKPMTLYMLWEALQLWDVAEDGNTVEQMSYETELLKLAKKQQMPVTGIETIDDQLGSLLDSIPYDEQAQMLMESIKAEAPETEEGINPLIELYKAQDIEGLYQTIHGEGDEISTFENAMLVSRNKNWIPVMAKLMSESPTFFAVGAGHLGGSIGVIALLREAGYKLTPIW